VLRGAGQGPCKAHHAGRMLILRPVSHSPSALSGLDHWNGRGDAVHRVAGVNDQPGPGGELAVVDAGVGGGDQGAAKRSVKSGARRRKS